MTHDASVTNTAEQLALSGRIPTVDSAGNVWECMNVVWRWSTGSRKVAVITQKD